MKFRTEYKPVRSSLTLDPAMPIVLIGSCFASNIASKMRECMWNAYNGAGTLYNPMSIAKVLDLMIFGDDSLESFKTSLFESEGIVHSWLFDSHFSGLSKEECLATIGESRSRLLDALDKAQLHLAIESICEHTKDCLYFQAYELVCDDLRDYRFYASDMMHPSESAVEYIWEIFCNTFLDSKGEELLRQGNRRFKAANHHPNIKIR